MTRQASEIQATIGQQAARFAQRAAGRFAVRPSRSRAFEARLAARRQAARMLPLLTASLEGILPKVFESVRPIYKAQAIGTPAKFDHLRPAVEPTLPGLSAQMQAREEAALWESARVPPRSPARPVPVAHPADETRWPQSHDPGHSAPALLTGPADAELRREARPLPALPPAALRTTLLRQGGAGEMLDSRLREKLRPHLKFDPHMARLHRGAAAATAARDLDAQAFTIGTDVFFGTGRYAPAMREGYGLLAHELTHVGQQAGLTGSTLRFFTPHGGDALEREAQQTAGQALAAVDQEKGNRMGGALHQAAAPPQPALSYSLPLARLWASRPIPAEMATEESGVSAPKVDARETDARAVTDRVYELMKREIASDRQRGVVSRKGVR